MKVWDLETRRVKAFSTETSLWHPESPTAFALSHDGTILAAAWTENRARLWDVHTGQELAVVAGPQGGILALTFSPDGKLLAGGCRDNDAWLWEVPSGKGHSALKGRRAIVKDVEFSPDGKRLIASGNDGLIELWDVASKQVVLTMKSPVDWSCHGLFSPDGNVFVVANSLTSVGRPFVQVLRPGTLADIDATIKLKLEER